MQWQQTHSVLLYELNNTFRCKHIQIYFSSVHHSLSMQHVHVKNVVEMIFTFCVCSQQFVWCLQQLAAEIKALLRESRSSSVKRCSRLCFETLRMHRGVKSFSARPPKKCQTCLIAQQHSLDWNNVKVNHCITQRERAVLTARLKIGMNVIIFFAKLINN